MPSAAAVWGQPGIAAVSLHAGAALEALLPTVLEQHLPANVRWAQPLLTGLLQAALNRFDAVVTTQPGAITVTSASPLPFLTPAIAGGALGNLGKSRLERDVAAAQARMKKIAQALRRYHNANGMPPDSLQALAPAFLSEVPVDPFGQGDDFGYAVAVGGDAWILSSVGPDGVPDLELNGFNLAVWEEIGKSTDPGDVAEMKGLLHRFNPKQHEDERDPEDEGDIVVTGRW
jgi:hypothetical protein